MWLDRGFFKGAPAAEEGGVQVLLRKRHHGQYDALDAHAGEIGVKGEAMMHSTELAKLS